MTERLFPIMVASHRATDEVRALRAAGASVMIIALPWDLLAPHEKQAQTNHGQSLERLAERGGLGPCEAVAILEDRRWRRMPPGEANRSLARILMDWTAA